MRRIPPWVGTTDDAKIPLQVQMRILLKQGGCCAVTGHKFMPGDAKHLDHKIPLADGGLHAEGNLRWILATEHKAKTADEATVRARVRSLAARHAGIKQRKAWGHEKAAKEPLEVAAGKTSIQRRFGL